MVVVEIADPLSAKTAIAGDKFNLRLAQPIVIGGTVVVPAGAPGVGEVIDAAPPGMGGKPAKLILAARYVESGGERLRLQSFKLGGGGTDYTGASVMTMEMVGVFGLAVQGGNVDYPAGTRASAKLAADVTIPAAAQTPLALASPPPSAPPPSPAAPNTSNEKGPTP